METFNFAAPTDASWMWMLAYGVSPPQANARLQADAMAFARSTAKINPTPQGLGRRRKGGSVPALYPLLEQLGIAR
jgi:hypothetical protein